MSEPPDPGPMTFEKEWPPMVPMAWIVGAPVLGLIVIAFIWLVKS